MENRLAAIRRGRGDIRGQGVAKTDVPHGRANRSWHGLWSTTSGGNGSHRPFRDAFGLFETLFFQDLHGPHFAPARQFAAGPWKADRGDANFLAPNLPAFFFYLLSGGFSTAQVARAASRRAAARIAGRFSHRCEGGCPGGPHGEWKEERGQQESQNGRMAQEFFGRERVSWLHDGDSVAESKWKEWDFSGQPLKNRP